MLKRPLALTAAACAAVTILFALLALRSVNEPAPVPGRSGAGSSDPGSTFVTRSGSGSGAFTDVGAGAATVSESPSPSDGPLLDAWRAGGEPLPVAPGVLARVAPRRTEPARAPDAEAGRSEVRIESIEIEWDWGAPLTPTVAGGEGESEKGAAPTRGTLR